MEQTQKFEGKSSPEGARHTLGSLAELFPFHTRVISSVIDGKSTILLDYDLPDNAALIRKIHDEIRQVSPGLFLGPAMWKTASGPSFVLWFALDMNDQSRPIGSA